MEKKGVIVWLRIIFVSLILIWNLGQLTLSTYLIITSSSLWALAIPFSLIGAIWAVYALREQINDL